MVFDISLFNHFLWISLSVFTTATIAWSLYRKRETPLDKRVSFLMLSMLIVWFGHFLIPFEIYIGLTGLWVSTIIVFLGGLRICQVMLEWRFGKWVWLKLLALVLSLTCILVGIFS